MSIYVEELQKKVMERPPPLVESFSCYYLYGMWMISRLKSMVYTHHNGMMDIIDNGLDIMTIKRKYIVEICREKENNRKIRTDGCERN